MVRELRVYDDKLLAQTTTSDKVVLPDGHDPADVAGLNVDVDLHSDDQVEEDTPGGRISVNPPVQSLGQNLINLNRIWQSERYFFNRKVSPRFKDHQVIKQRKRRQEGNAIAESNIRISPQTMMVTSLVKYHLFKWKLAWVQCWQF